MAQQSIAAYFNARKRAATEDLNSARSKVFLAGDSAPSVNILALNGTNEINNKTCRIIFNDEVKEIGQKEIIKKRIENICTNDVTKLKAAQPTKTRSSRPVKRTETSNGKISKLKTQKQTETSQLKQQNLVKFFKCGYLSPHNKLKLLPEEDSTVVITSRDNALNIERSTKTVQKIQNKNDKNDATNLKKEQLDNMVKKELNFDEVKTKITRSAKLQELKASINRIKELEKVRKLQEEKSKKLKNGENSGTKTSLKKFEILELEVLTSPQKGFKTPTKQIISTKTYEDKNELMSPKKVPTPKKVLFSPSKNPSPSKINEALAHQKLQMPYKYRCLIEIFRTVDSVCAMFYNRKELITFKKLKPAVQRILRKNFYESHLAQIKHLYPDAFQFTQKKTRNFGSISKQDYFQLVITPIIDDTLSKQMKKIDEDNLLKSADESNLNPQLLTKRLQKFSNILLNIVKDEHGKFLKTLDPPLEIPKDKIRRWHPEFDLETCPNIEEGTLPKPPNIEKFSSAKDILLTTRNLFNCATTMDTKKAERKQGNDVPSNLPPESKLECATFVNEATQTNSATESILKGVPKSLLEKIRAKQAAKVLHSMVRSGSDDSELIKYSRLPELARHLRNVFITEKKGVLQLGVVLKKIENSYKTLLTEQDIEAHLKLISKELPTWLVFHEIRNTIYIKLDREMDLTEVTQTLTKITNEKFK